MIEVLERPAGERVEIDTRTGSALDELLRDGLEACLAGESPAIVARRLWSATPDKGELADDLAPRGLAELLRVEIYAHNERAASESVRGLKSTIQRSPTFVSWSGVLSQNYQGADGTRKPLAMFTREDARHLAADSRAKANGLAALADAMELAASLLSDEQTIADLPAKKRLRVEQAIPA